MDELINLLIDTARKISDTEVSYKPLKLLDFNGNNGMDIFLIMSVLSQDLLKNKEYRSETFSDDLR